MMANPIHRDGRRCTVERRCIGHDLWTVNLGESVYTGEGKMHPADIHPGVTKQIIDYVFGWCLKEMAHDMQLHYAGIDHLARRRGVRSRK